MKKKILISVAAVVALFVLLGVLQALVVPKYAMNQEGLLTGEYYNHSGGHDVIFLGDCEVYESFVPSVFWQDYGITSYIRGSAQQLVWHSYYLLEETFKYEKPKAVVFNVYALKYGEPQSEAYNRMTFDTMRWSTVKVKGILNSMTDDESFIDYLFPLLRYHSRITELKGEDFKYWFNDPEVMTDNGYLIKTGVEPMKQQDPITDAPEELLSVRAMDYLEKIRVLCENNGSELILVKAPTNPRGYWWYDEWDEQVRQYAENNSLAYYNFISEAEQIGIDWQTDTYDEGLHLNVYGAEKFSRYFGQILAKNHSLTSRKDDEETASLWNGYLNEYLSKKKEMEGKANEKD